MTKNERNQSEAEPGLSILLNDLLECRSRYGDLAVARPLTATERRHISEARQAIEAVRIEPNLVPWPITHEPSLRRIAKSLANAPDIRVDIDAWLDKHAFYFALVPLRLTDQSFERAFITLRSHYATTPEGDGLPLFLELYPKTTRVSKGEVDLAVDAGLTEHASIGAAAPSDILDVPSVVANAGIEGHINTKLALSYNFAKAWSDVQIDVSAPPTAEAEWRIKDAQVLHQQVQALAFILQVPRTMKTCKISYGVRLQFQSPPWEKTIQKWVAELKSRLFDIPEPQRGHISLLDNYVRTGFWSSEYREQEMIWEIDLTHHGRN